MGEIADTHDHDESETTVEPRKRHVASKILTAMGAASLAVLLFADSCLDLLGDAARFKNETELNAEGWAAKKADFSTRSPQHKFEQDFITGTVYQVEKRKPGNGFLGVMTSKPEYVYRYFGSPCLAPTDYDTSHDTDSHKAAKATYSTDYPDMISVKPADPDLPVLHLLGAEGDNLRPEDIESVSILAYFDCDMGLYEAYTVDLHAG